MSETLEAGGADIDRRIVFLSIYSSDIIFLIECKLHNYFKMIVI